MFLDYFKKKKDAGTKCSRFLVDSYCKLRRVYFHLYGTEFESCKVEEYIAMNSKKSVEKTHTCSQYTVWKNRKSDAKITARATSTFL